MGILWSLLEIEDCVILEYGPAGTTHFSMNLFRDLGEDQQNRLFTTHMSENDVIMGDVERLEKALLEIDSSFHPKTIFVVSSSVAAVIGTDIKGVCTYMQERLKARLIAFEQGGFRGDYSVGLFETYKLLVAELAKDEVDMVPGTVNILGASMGAYRTRSDRNELERLLCEGLGLKVGAYLCGKTSITDIENMGGAELNIVLREEAIPAAMFLKRKFGTPVVAGSPYGYKGTLKWLQKVGKAVGREVSPKMMKEIEERIEDTSGMEVSAMMLRQDRPSASLVGEYRTILGIGEFLEEMGIHCDNKICLHTLKNIPGPDESVIYCKSEKERLDILRPLRRSFILGDDPSMSVCDKENVFLRISTPVVTGRQVSDHLPLMGVRGADIIMESVYEYMQMLI